MRRHEIITETEEFDGNASLLDYFQTRPVTMEHDSLAEDAWNEWTTNYLNDANKAAFCKRFGVDDIADLDCTCYNDLPPKAMRAFADFLENEGYTRSALHDDPASAPAWMLLEPVVDHLLPSTTWLIHFSDHAEAIAREGFRFGVPDPDRIALTFKHDIYSGQATRIGGREPGYNFAYALNGRFKPSTRTGGYGAHAILFQSSGMLLHHSGDREEQVAFWGPSANATRGIVITNDGTRWVSSTRGKGRNLDLLVNRLLKQRMAKPASQDEQAP